MRQSVSNSASIEDHSPYGSPIERPHIQLAALLSEPQNQEQKYNSPAPITSPASLMSRLMTKACSLLTAAKVSLNENDTESFHNATLHASQIILSMRCLIDSNADARLAADFFSAYTVIASSLRKARENRDAATISAIFSTLDELRAAWQSVA